MPVPGSLSTRIYDPGVAEAGRTGGGGVGRQSMNLETPLVLDAENDVTRSRHIRRLVHSSETELGRRCRSWSSSSIPQVIVQFWHSVNNVPDDVGSCLRSWDALKQEGFGHLLFDDISAHEFIAAHLNETNIEAFERCTHPAMRSDLFRLCFLVVNGGFYVDADEVYVGGSVEHLFEDGCLKLRPVCYDPGARAMVRWSEARTTHLTPSAWTYYVDNNLLVAPPEHPTLVLALERATRKVLETDLGRTRDIQSMTGPGNLSASLVAHSLLTSSDEDADFELRSDWDQVSATKWDLTYRNDVRNWRRWRRTTDDLAHNALLALEATQSQP